MTTVNRPKPTDATGRARAKAIKENATELQRRQDEITTIAAAEAYSMQNDVFDPKQIEEPLVIDEIITVGADLADDTVIIRLVSDIETMSWGYGNNYSFAAGVKYKVPKDLANHLDSLGYLYTM